MADEDWYMIHGLIQDIFLVRKGLASLEFNDALTSKLRENCDSEETINQLKKLVFV
jgi:hypothetical protein